MSEPEQLDNALKCAALLNVERERLAAENAQLRAIVEAAKPVLFHISRGRRAAFIDVYPDAAARRALGLFNEWEASRV